MSGRCDEAQARLIAALTGEAPEAPAWAEEHAQDCVSCGPVLKGSEALTRDLDAWQVEPPADDLVARTLARLALAGAGSGAGGLETAEPASPEPTTPEPTSPEPAAPEPALAPVTRLPTRASRRRTSFELLTTASWTEPVSAEPPPRRTLLVRLVAQAAAAAVLVFVCGTFAAVYYPAVVYALAESEVAASQEQLRTISQAIVRYRQEQPDAPALAGPALRRALVEGGYLDQEDLISPSRRGRELGQRSYWLVLPDGPLEPGTVVAYDRPGNHTLGFNVAYADGRVELVEVERLGEFLSRRRD